MIKKIQEAKNKLNKILGDKRRQQLNLYLSAGLALIMLLVVLISFYSPVVTSMVTSDEISHVFKLRPYDLLTSRVKEDLSFGTYSLLTVSYYVNKYFYLIFALTAGTMLFVVLFCLIKKSKNIYKVTNFVMFIMSLFLFVSMLIGINYLNIYLTLYPWAIISTSANSFFIVAIVLLLLKLAAGILFNKSGQLTELKESGNSLVTSFVSTACAVGTLFTPFYIFPGTPYRMNGLNILFGGKDIVDILGFLPMSNIYKTIIGLFTIAVIISFVINITLFLIKRKVFLHYDKFHITLSTLALTLYALIGLNYMIVYVDAGGFNEYLALSMNTYSYIPLVLMAVYWLGSTIAKKIQASIKVEYRITGGGIAGSIDGGFLGGSGGSSAFDAGIGGAKANDNGPIDPIPAFSELDGQLESFKEDYSMRMRQTFEGVTLPKLVSHIIDYAKNSEDRLSYGPVEIKTFLAGLASSRLSILQGMSGTGKTSLPKIFMQAIYGICDLVAVESSWRDKNELLGYYNQFNKRYTPKSFTQFLYKASLNKEIPYFIVLDEMNLSRIEYYFSDFLSLMESHEDERYLKLFDVQLFPRIDGRAGYLALRDGHTLDIPPNVWFVGTANRDESTFEISDKVYDRAQTINFDKRASKVNISGLSGGHTKGHSKNAMGDEYSNQTNNPKKFVPYLELRRLFDETKSVGFDAENYLTIKKIEELLAPYRISFGNRILNQIEMFVNAYVSASEIVTDNDRKKYIHEAVDCIMYSKVVRKLELKQAADIDTLIEEFADLKLNKCEEFLRTLQETL